VSLVGIKRRVKEKGDSPLIAMRRGLPLRGVNARGGDSPLFRVQKIGDCPFNEAGDAFRMSTQPRVKGTVPYFSGGTA
jgi:hypothetical protein